MFRLELTRTPDNTTMIALARMRAAETIACHIFGDRAMDAPHLRELRQAIERHVASRCEFAALMHLGARATPVLLGEPDLFGSEAEQSARVSRFFAEAETTFGAFGPWWAESFAHLENLALSWKRSAMLIRLFIRTSREPPLDYDGDAIERWIGERPAGGEHRLIVSEKMNDAEYDFDDLLAEGRVTVERQPSRILVMARDGRKLPMPRPRLSGTSVRRGGRPNVVEIMLPSSFRMINVRADIASLDGISAEQLWIEPR
jgi:hypothetical protein